MSIRRNHELRVLKAFSDSFSIAAGVSRLPIGMTGKVGSVTVEESLRVSAGTMRRPITKSRSCICPLTRLWIAKAQ